MAENTPKSETEQLLELEYTIVNTLKRMQSKFADDSFLFEFRCPPSDKEGWVPSSPAGLNGEWSLCGTSDSRTQLLKHSTFSLIIAPTNYSVISSVVTQVRIYEALKYGAIPIILGSYIQLPFANGELLHTKKAAITLPKQRVSELHFVVRSIADVDILEYRRQGRILWETFMATTQKIVDSTLAILRSRLNIPSFPVREEPSPSVFNDTFTPLKEQVPDPEPEGEADILGNHGDTRHLS